MRERTATVNSLTALVRTGALGVDARKALTVSQLRQIAGWRTRLAEPIDVAVARVEATRLARHALGLSDQAAVKPARFRHWSARPLLNSSRFQGSGP